MPPNLGCTPTNKQQQQQQKKQSQCSHSDRIICFSTVNPVMFLGLASFCCAFQDLGLNFSVAFLCCLVSDFAEITVTAGNAVRFSRLTFHSSSVLFLQRE